MLAIDECVYRFIQRGFLSSFFLTNVNLGVSREKRRRPSVSNQDSMWVWEGDGKHGYLTVCGMNGWKEWIFGRCLARMRAGGQPRRLVQTGGSVAWLVT